MLSVLAVFVINFIGIGAIMEPFVVGGERAPIEYYAHSAFLSIRDLQGAYICGSSILNQNVLLSAAHCFESCKNAAKIFAFVGNANRNKGKKYQVATFKTHEHYDSYTVSNDVAIAVLQSALPLGPNVKRVAILRYPLSMKKGTVAGWGLIDEIKGVKSSWLHFAEQNIWSLSQCKKVLPGIPAGSLCAGDLTKNGYASEGDSGSALIVNDYIQIGIVSFKRPEKSRSLVVYTNVSYFYGWIKQNSRMMYCSEKHG